jgi:hypothetical protein
MLSIDTRIHKLSSRLFKALLLTQHVILHAAATAQDGLLGDPTQHTVVGAVHVVNLVLTHKLETTRFQPLSLPLDPS